MAKGSKLFNLTIARSFAVAPVAAILALAAVAGLGTWSLIQASASQTRVIEGMEVGVDLTRMQTTLETINADVFQIITAQAAGQGVDVMAAFEPVATNIDGLSAEVEALRERLAEAIGTPIALNLEMIPVTIIQSEKPGSEP